MRSVSAMTMVAMTAVTACSVGGTAAPVSPMPAQVLPNGDSGSISKEAGTVGLPLNRCTQASIEANDLTAPGDARIIAFTTRVVNPYATPCMKIKVGQSVTWSSADGGGAAFLSHPLIPYGGNADTPITRNDEGDSKTFTFATAGLFGFACEMHTVDMQGAILVVP
jgi:plastocyanin